MMVGTVFVALACTGEKTVTQTPVDTGTTDADVADTGSEVASDAATDTSADTADQGPDATETETSAPQDATAAVVCGKFDDGTYGKKKPWTSFTGPTSKGSKSFTCNVCRGGYPNMQGTWRLIDFKTEDPTQDKKEALTFDGNTFASHYRETTAGKTVETKASGWYFCADPAEMTTGDTVFVVDAVDPPTALTEVFGPVFRASVKTDASDPVTPPSIALGLSAGLDGKFVGEFVYCRVGATWKGKPCADPFK
jgi:hypothetical protein